MTRIVRLDPLVAVRVATRNADKGRELITLWGAKPPPLVLAAKEYPEVDETSDTYEGNALLKARALAEATGGPALADDSGIEVEALAWGPGVKSARTPSASASWQERNEYILRAVDASGGSRRARFVCVCALLVLGSEPVLARGEVEGLIADAPRGDNGFGYDPIFVYPPYGSTFAQVPAEMKHAVSHRGRAVRALRAMLDQA